MAHDALHAFMNGESVDEFMFEIIPVPDQLYCTHILKPKNFSKAKAIELSQKRLENNPEMTLNTVFEGPPDDEFYRFENEFIISKTKLRFYQVDLGADLELKEAVAKSFHYLSWAIFGAQTLHFYSTSLSTNASRTEFTYKIY